MDSYQLLKLIVIEILPFLLTATTIDYMRNGVIPSWKHRYRDVTIAALYRKDNPRRFFWAMVNFFSLPHFSFVFGIFMSYNRS